MKIFRPIIEPLPDPLICMKQKLPGNAYPIIFQIFELWVVQELRLLR